MRTYYSQTWMNPKKSPKVIVVVGGQWGDEGKGTISDRLAKKADLILRANGGANAGHTIGDIVLHQVPDGILYPDKINLIGQGVVLDIVELIKEIKLLQTEHHLNFKNFRISDHATLLFDFYKAIEAIEENARKECLGTTKRGIGPSYADRIARNALLARDLLDPQICLQKLEIALKLKSSLYNIPKELKKVFEIDYYKNIIKEASEFLSPYIIDSHQLVQQYLKAGKTILIGGAQGTLLDIQHGTYPFVTSSPCTIDGLLYSVGIPSKYLTESWGVFKAYMSRVGSGPFPTMYLGQNEDIGDLIREKGNERGATTGRNRGIGRFDCELARFSQEINAFSHIVITRLDILTNVDNLEICQNYDKKAQPVYTKLKSWNTELTKDYEQWPEAAKKYCQMIMSSFKNCPSKPKLASIGFGPNRDNAVYF